MEQKQATVQVAKASAVVTHKYDFFNATRAGDKLFSVRAGIPLSDAFDQLSLFIAASQSGVEESRLALGEDVPSPQWATSHLLEFTYALVQAMHSGFTDWQGTDASPSP